MQIKLELKHLSPYLPYNLKSVSYNKDLENVSDIIPSNIMKFIDNDTMAKPILRPISDMINEIEYNGERFVPIEYLRNKYSCLNLDFDVEGCFILGEDSVNYKYLPYMVINKLFQWHFDIFGLIDKGLAVDINTVKKYKVM